MPFVRGSIDSPHRSSFGQTMNRPILKTRYILHSVNHVDHTSREARSLCATFPRATKRVAHQTSIRAQNDPGFSPVSRLTFYATFRSCFRPGTYSVTFTAKVRFGFNDPAVRRTPEPDKSQYDNVVTTLSKSVGDSCSTCAMVNPSFVYEQ